MSSGQGMNVDGRTKNNPEEWFAPTHVGILQRQTAPACSSVFRFHTARDNDGAGFDQGSTEGVLSGGVIFTLLTEHGLTFGIQSLQIDA